MKLKLLLPVLILIVSGEIFAQKSKPEIKYSGLASVNVDISRLANKNGKFSAVGTDNKQYKIEIDGDKLSFSDTLTEPGIVNLLFTGGDMGMSALLKKGENVFSFYLMPGVTNAVADTILGGTVITNPKPAQKDYEKVYNEELGFYRAYVQPLLSDLMKANADKDTARLMYLIQRYDSLNRTVLREQIQKPFIVDNASKSPVALSYLISYAGVAFDYDQIQPLYEKLNPEFKELPSGKILKEKLLKAELTSSGKPALGFTQNDTLGNPVSLSDFKGKYVLVDFWASWCGPCRAENPNLVKAFDKYKDKGFTVLGVSLDNDRGKWISAIHEDGLFWTQVSDLKGGDNEVAVLYEIKAIPQNLLVDPNGKIVGKNLRGEELNKKLEAIFGK